MRTGIPQHGLSFLAAWVMLVCMLGLGVLFLPGVVNGVSYLSGGNSVLFVPQSWQPTCSYYYSTGNVCSTSTNGILETGGAGIERHLAGPGAAQPSVPDP